MGGMDDAALLNLIHRSRPRTPSDLAEIAHRNVDDVTAALARLADIGAVSVDDGVISSPHPAAWAAGVVADRTRALRESTAAATAEIDELVSTLPSLLRHWSVGQTSGEIAPVFVRHGPRAAEDLWFDTSRESTGIAWSVLPDVERFLTSGPERAARFGAAFGGKSSVRALLPRSILRDERLVGMAGQYGAVGVQFRVLDDLPSWFWIDGDILALPFEWGEAWPTSVIGVRNAALAGLGRSLYEELWARAEPVDGTTHPWTPLLQLMRRGTTLDSASRALGINPRTGRRRVAAAMEHYGVSTLFALGVAWAADADRAR